jgi:hypothetical protein
VSSYDSGLSGAKTLKEETMKWAVIALAGVVVGAVVAVIVWRSVKSS